MIEIILLIISFALFFLVTWQDLKWGLALIILMLPSYLVRFKIGFVPATFLEILILIVFLVWLIKLKLRSSDFKFERRDFFWPILFFVLASTVAVLVSPDVESGLGFWKAYIVEPILFFIVFINVVKERKDIKLMLSSLMVLSLFISVLAILQYGGLIYSPEPYFSEIPRRVTSIFPFPTAIGKLLAPVAALFLGLILVKRKNIEGEEFSMASKFLFLITLILTIVTFFFSMNRGALFGLTIAFIFLSLFSHYKKWIWAGIIVLIIVALSLPLIRNEITSIALGRDTSADVHLIMWQGTWRLLKARPIQGAGLGGFPLVYNIYRDPAHVELFPNPDNLYLTLWVELGSAGLIVFIWILIEFFRRACQLKKKFQNNDFVFRMTVSLMASMTAFLTHGLVDTPFFKNDLAVAFWLLVALLVVIFSPLQKSKNAL